MSWIDDNIIRTFQSVLTDVKAFLHRQRWKEALIFSCFVLLSFGFWILQSLKLEYETEMSIPIRYNNVPADIVFTNKLPEKAFVKLKDKGSALINYSIGQNFKSINIDLANLPKEQTTTVISKKVIEDEIQKHMLATTNVYDFEPQTIALNYGLRKSKEVPVKFNGYISTEKGFLVSSDIQITPMNVTIYGNETLLDSIHEIQTVYMEITKGKKNITKSVDLSPVEGIKLDIKSVSVTIPIEEFTEKTLSIPVLFKNVPRNYNVRSFPQKVEVSCNIPISKFNEVEDNMFAIEIPFSQLEENVSGTLNVSITQKPDWIRYCSVNPGKIEFLLEQK